MNWRSPEKNFLKSFFFFFFLENACACVLGPWPGPRALLSLASIGSVLGKAVLGLEFFCVLGLESFVLDSTFVNVIFNFYLPVRAKLNLQRWSPRERPREHILKSLALASKPQVLENWSVLGSRTGTIFELLKFCSKTPETSRKICKNLFLVSSSRDRLKRNF